MDYLISESSINKKLGKIFKKPLEQKNHILLTDFICTYIIDRISLGYENYYNINFNDGYIPTNSYTPLNKITNNSQHRRLGMSIVNRHKNNKLITKINYRIEEFTEALKKLLKCKEDKLYIKFKYSDFLSRSPIRISESNINNILTDLSEHKFNVNFPLCVIPEKYEGTNLDDDELKCKELSIDLKNTSVIQKHKYKPISRYNSEYEISLNSRIIIYAINNILQKHYSNINFKYYNPYNLPTASMMFMKRFMIPFTFKRSNDKKLKYETINRELNIQKTNLYIKRNILQPLERENLIDLFVGKNSVKITFLRGNKFVGRFSARA